MNLPDDRRIVMADQIISQLFGLGASTRAVARMFGVSQSTASRWCRAVTPESSDLVVTAVGAALLTSDVTLESRDSACNACSQTRADRRYCSNACRQKAYRRRKTSQ